MDNKDRSESFKKNTEVEETLSLLEQNLSGIDESLIEKPTSSRFPPIFIFGCARSGTTVLHQYLIENIKCIYPSNFLSRFYYAPFLGGLYYKLFTDLDQKGELLGNTKANDLSYSSDLGKTKGVHSPNEFWYFWRKHFKINEKGTIDRTAVREENVQQFKNSIYALQNLFQGPFIAKGLIANNCIEILEDIFQKPIFVFIKRDLFDNARSIYDARIKFFGTPNKWYSFYPAPKEKYQSMSPEEQVVRQVIDTNYEITDSLKKCDQNQVYSIGYNAFCENPAQVITYIQGASDEIEIQEELEPKQFTIRKRSRGLSDIDQKIQSLVRELS